MAAECNVSPSTMCRIIKHHKKPDADSLANILTWLGAKFEDFVTPTPASKDGAE